MFIRSNRYRARTLVTVVASSILLCLTAACGGSGSAEGSGETSSNRTVTVGVGPFLSQAGFWVALDEGYFEEVGLDIKVENFIDGSLAVPALVTGELDVAGLTAAASLFNSSERGASFKLAVDGAREREGYGLAMINVSKKLAAQGVNGIGDFGKLKGKRIGVTAAGSINQYIAAQALKQAGLDPAKDVEWVIGIAQPDLIGALKSGRVDAISVTSNIAYAAEQSGAGPVVFRGYETSPDMQTIMYGMSEKFLKDRRDVAVLFTQALLKGVAKYNSAFESETDRDAVFAALAAHTTLKKTEAVEALFPGWLPWASPDSRLNVDSLEEQQQFWTEFGMVDSPIDMSQLVDTTLVEDALKASGLG